MKLLAFLVVMPLAFSVATAEMITKTVEYHEGSIVLEGYLAYDDALKGNLPGVLIVHDWTGLGDYAKSRADQLAKLGYVALAVDIYGKGVRPKNAEEAGVQATIYRKDRPLMRRRAIAGLGCLRSQPMVDTAQIAAMGYCFGGGVALELARSGAPISGTVSFHGNLDTPNPADAKNIKGRVLVLHGADDPYVPAEQVTAFETEMRDAGVDWQMVKYGGAVHSFTNPAAGDDRSRGAAYNAAADRRSWEALRQFLAEIFSR